MTAVGGVLAFIGLMAAIFTTLTIGITLIGIFLAHVYRRESKTLRKWRAF